MAGKRRLAPAVGPDRQIRFQWLDPADVLAAASQRGGAVVYEAPDTSRIVRGKPVRLPRVRVKRAAEPSEPPSRGLPFGARRIEGRVTCWSCAQELAEHQLVHVGPGLISCPGCGARLPFSE